MPGSVVVGGARTPIGKFAGALSTLSAMELGGIAIAGALERAGIAPDEVDYVFMGHVLGAGQGQITARQAAARAGIPLTVPATTVNKVCLSGINALYLADLMITSGAADVVVAGGMESMSQAPYLVPGARSGLRMGDGALVDSMLLDGLTDPIHHEAMGLSTEGYNGAAIGRDRQDAFAVRSHEKAATAQKEGRLAEEIVPVAVPQRRGEPILVAEDEGIRADTSLEGLGALRPAFSADGTITAGNSSQISDGAAALVVTSRAKAEQLGLAPWGELVAYGQVAGPDTSLLTQPSRAIAQALAHAGRDLAAVDLFEVNEAFAVVALASADELRIDHDRLNVNGGAVALGHPIGASGARLVLSVLTELRRRGGGLGAAALCGGGGQGDAALLAV
jgi:acetyl-CoA C-acetyltransferase